jgi:cyanophycinase
MLERMIRRRALRSPFGQRGMRGAFSLILFILIGSCAPAGSLAVQETTPERDAPRVGPANGTLVVAGGGSLGPEIWERFVELGGGPDSRIVVIPTAGTDDSYPDDWSGLQGLQRAGAGQILLLHTRDRTEANSEAFAEAIRGATGVWFPGGRQFRLVDAYLNTRVHEELFALLERGGVIGGTSAGASVQASFLVRGDPATNTILVSPDYQVGFGFLAETAIDQHLLARNRQEDLWELLEIQPDLLGIGLDEGTAIVVQGDQAEVIGRSRVILFDASGLRREVRSLGPGDVVDLSRPLAGIAAPELVGGSSSHHP